MRALETYLNNTYARKAAGHSGFKKLLSTYRIGAKKRNLAFDLTEDAFRKLVLGDCHYCGQIPNQISRIQSKSYTAAGISRSEFVHNGIDRVQNTKGYTAANCVSCCKTCNFAKLQMGKSQFIHWIIRVYKHQQTRAYNL